MVLEIAGTIIGIIYLWQEYNASINLWITSIIMPAIYLFVYYNAGLYADFGINIYYLVIAVYGWLSWRYSFSITGKAASKNGEELKISSISKCKALILLSVFAVVWLSIAFILTKYTDSTVPVTDAFTTALSIIGMYMLARKYLEQWIIWTVVDIVCVGLYFHKELYFTSVLYAVYAIIAIFGYRKWKAMMQHAD